MILVVSSPHDVHARRVLEELAELGAEAVVVDLSDFPRHSTLTVTAGNGRSQGRLALPDRLIDLTTVTAVWWRRPQALGLHEELDGTRHVPFTLGECTEAITGVWQRLRTRSLWINDLNKDEAAHRKLLQLQVAEDVGLRVPRTVVTNDPADARAFIAAEEPARVVYKAFSATRTAWRETRLVGADELGLLGSVRFAPVIFQEYVPAVYDVRVTMVGSDVFAAAIHSQQTSYAVDFRMDMDNAHVEPVTLPAPVRDRLLDLMERLGLVYGAIDLRRTPTDEWVFLEINPAGQFLFVEQETGQPIAAALARRLAGS